MIPPNTNEGCTAGATRKVSKDAGVHSVAAAHNSSTEPEAAESLSENAIWKELFDTLDQDHNGQLSQAELEAAMQNEAQLMLSQSHKLRELMEAIKQGKREGVSFREFAEVMSELFLLRYQALFKSARVDMHLAASAWKHVTGEDGCLAVLREECQHIQAFQSFKGKTHEQRVQIFQTLLTSMSAPLAERMALDIVAAGEYELQQDEVQGKFAGMELADPLCFDCGIDVLGLPDLDFQNAISREHATEEEFEAWNDGKLRRTNPAEQLAKVLPHGWDGRINNKTYDGHQDLCAVFEEHPTAKAAGLSKAELVMTRMYTGPMYAEYNGLLRSLVPAMKRNWTGEKNTASVREAMETALKDVGAKFVTSILVLVSALLKLRLVSRLPASRKVYRGFSGLSVPECFKGEDERGNRGGVEFGFLSTSRSKQHAVGYINFKSGMPQLYEIDVGQIDRGADLSWISYFPSEVEMLMPPLCSLEASGDAAYEDIDVRDGRGAVYRRKVMVWPVRLNVNLRGKTVDEHKANRKRLHAQMADNALSEVSSVVAGARLEADADPEAAEEELGGLIRKQCEDVVHEYRQRTDHDLNDDNGYSAAIRDALFLVPFASALLEMKTSSVAGVGELKHIQLRGCLPSVRQHERSSTARVKATIALAVSRRRGLVGEDLEQEDSLGCTALAACAKAGRKEEVALLLLCHARIDARDRKGNTPLIHATEHGHHATARVLVGRGADVNACNDVGHTALFLACARNTEGMVSELLDGATGVDVDAGDTRYGTTPLMRASMRGLSAAARALLDRGAEVNARDMLGCTALIWACAACVRGCEETACMLVERGADVAAASEDGKTALFWAADHGLLAAASMLVDRGADPNAEPQDGLTPASVARSRGHGAVAAMLEERGGRHGTAAALQMGRAVEAAGQGAGELGGGPYYLEFQGEGQHGRPRGGWLHALSEWEDQRDADSRWVCIHAARHEGCCEWLLRPAHSPGAYYIELAGAGGAESAGEGGRGSLHAFGDRRDGTREWGSTWLCLHDEKFGSNSEFRLERADAELDTYWIELVGSRELGAPAGASLHAFGGVRGAEWGQLASESTWVCVHDEKYDLASQWRLVPVDPGPRVVGGGE